ncbi:hypothetical protein SEUCBS139899_000172 [Sporothrix eucalyptigena]|uniref:Sugar phosphate transporter domain-containing protein n=1 Tax=Sporothrix eucalyptigena TaxID=1812306 RepID=A0ABP0C649_9PEZI
MPSPKPIRTAPVGASSASTLATTDADAGAGIELASIGSSSSGASGRPRRRSSLLKSSAPGSTVGRPRKASTAASTATATGTTSRLQPRDDAGDGDHWDDAWGEDFGDEGHAGGRDDDQTLFEDDYGGSSSDLHTDEETGLSAGGRRQREETRQQRTNFDQRFVPMPHNNAGEDFGFGDGRLRMDDPQSSLIMASLTEDERKEADKNVLWKLVLNGSLIGLWYLFSLSISLYNKWMFGSNFPFPLFTTSIHMLVQFLLACLVLYFVPSLRPQGGQKEGEPAMTRWFYFTRIGPCGAATGLDIGLGNASLKLITLTFYTMCKSSSLAFVLLFAFAFRLEQPTIRLVAIIATMTVGVVMMVAGEVEFDTFGFFLVISAAFFSGFRWGLTQIMLLRNPATSNPFSSIFYLAPVMFVTLFVLAIPMEGFPELIQGFKELADKFGAVRTPLLVLFPGTIAFLMTASEFALLQRTSVVTLSIAGIFKEVVTITTATLVFHDTLTLVNMLGLVVTMAAIIVYNYIKITKMRQQAQIEVHKGHQQQQHQQSAEGLQASTGPTQFGPGLGSSSTQPADHDDSDVDGDNDAEDAGLLRKP